MTASTAEIITQDARTAALRTFAAGRDLQEQPARPGQLQTLDQRSALLSVPSGLA